MYFSGAEIYMLDKSNETTKEITMSYCLPAGRKCLPIVVIMVVCISGLRAESVMEQSMVDGIAAINAGKLNESMNLLRKSVNCSGIEGRVYKKETRDLLYKLKEVESNMERKAALCVYLSVVEMVGGGKDQSIALTLLNEAAEISPELPEIYNTRGVVYSIGGFNL